MGGVGAAGAYNSIGNTTEAYIGDSATSVTASSGDVLVTATSTPTIETIAGALGVGDAVGLAGSVAINLMTNNTQAYISAATVHANGSVGVLASDSPEIDNYAGAVAGGVGVGLDGSLAINVFQATTLAMIEEGAKVSAAAAQSGDTISVPHWHDDTNGTQYTQSISGVAVVATVDETLNDLGTSIGLSAGLAAGLNATVNVFQDDVQANITGSTVDSPAAHGNDVIVRAYREVSITSAGGQLQVGEGAVGAALDAEFDSSTTAAAISGSTVYAGGGGVEVGALTRENLMSVIAGASVGLYVGLAGGASAAIVDSSTTATIGNQSIVDSDGGIAVLASSGVVLNLDDGVLGGSVGVGAGGSIAVGLIGQTTSATIDSSTTNASGETQVKADSTETVNSVVVAVGAGGVAGIAISLALVESTNTTSATIVDSKVNQDSSYAGPSQSVSVEADDKASVTDGIGGAALAGGVGLGAGVDVVSIKNSVDAHIAGNSLVNASGGVSVVATGTKDVSSTPISLSAAIGLALNGTVSVISIGGGLDSTGTGKLSGVIDDVNSTISLTNGISGTNSNDSTASTAQADTKNSGFNISPALAADPTTRDTGAYIGGTAKIKAGGDVTVKATETITDIQATVGQATGGILSVGESDAFITISSATLAYIGDAASVDAGGDVDVEANFSDSAQADLYAGSVGLLSYGGQVANVTDNSSETAYLGGTLTRANDVTVKATTDRTDDANTYGGEVSGIGVGTANLTVSLGGSVSASVDDGVQIGQAQGETVGSLTVTTTAIDNASATAEALNVGILGSVGYNDASATIDPTIASSIGNNVAATVVGAIDVQSTATETANSSTTGVTAGLGAGVGIDDAEATIGGTTDSTVGSNSKLISNGAGTSSAQLAITAASTEIASSYSSGTGGGAYGEGDATSTTDVTRSVAAGVGNSSTLSAMQGIDLEATNADRRAYAYSSNSTGGIVARATRRARSPCPAAARPPSAWATR